MKSMSGESRTRHVAAPTTSINRFAVHCTSHEDLGPRRAQDAADDGTGWIRTSRDMVSNWSDEEGNGNEVLIVGASPKNAHAGLMTENTTRNDRRRTSLESYRFATMVRHRAV